MFSFSIIQSVTSQGHLKTKKSIWKSLPFLSLELVYLVNLSQISREGTTKIIIKVHNVNSPQWPDIR